ncbi:hypothetical protein [Streptomyces sp. NPDC092952]|uniref:hypothetical protein n=1 Tax=Streptomyces sp. NPDC092952 TaxID=3366018 RepID=UPI003825678E
MTYNLLTVDSLPASLITLALSSCLRVESHSVDVANVDGDQESRNWDALALCDYALTLGDVSLSLDVFVQDSAPHRPTEPEFASSFAAAAQTLVLYPTEENIPSAYWLVTPTGSTTRARLLQSDDDQPRHSLDAVEATVPQLPDVRVMQLPEIAREQPVSTPVTSEFIQKMSRLRDSKEEAREFELSDGPGSPSYNARTLLAEWERMVGRMESGWHPTGKNPIDLYSEALLSRDLIETISGQLSESVADLSCTVPSGRSTRDSKSTPSGTTSGHPYRDFQIPSPISTNPSGGGKENPAIHHGERVSRIEELVNTQP